MGKLIAAELRNEIPGYPKVCNGYRSKNTNNPGKKRKIKS